MRRKIRAVSRLSPEDSSLPSQSPAPAASPEALIRSLAAAGNPVTEGWLPLLAGAATGAPGLDAESAGWLAAAAQNSSRLAELQAKYAEKQTRLWLSLVDGKAGRVAVAAPPPGDRRFAAAAWRDNPYFDYLKQSYLLAAGFLAELAEGADLQASAKERLRFALKQWTDALCPANFAATNPEVLRVALESRGESLTRGLANVIGDAQRRRIRQSDESAFEVGRNLAITPGDVVYQNDLVQLIQYAAATPQVGSRPLVMVPPCINKYYILDLQPENSFVRHAVAAGHTVFMVSWRNVGPAQGHFGWDDYLQLGIFEPFRVARAITGAERLNALGFCVGGTLLGAALGVLAARGESSVASATYLTTMLDFAEPGQIGVFVDEAGAAAREAEIGRGGVFPGATLAHVFNALRANDLIWPYVVNNYLLGGAPAPFDILYWNADSTNLPGPMYCYYVRNTYLENRLRVPRALRNCGAEVDLGSIRLPSFIYASREDHIVPWQAAYRSVGLLGGENEFVLGASGHIAGVINPPAAKRRSYWAGTGAYPEDPQDWFSRATEQRGSWWPRWTDWLARFRGDWRDAPGRTGSEEYPAREPAPGRYVKERASPA